MRMMKSLPKERQSLRFTKIFSLLVKPKKIHSLILRDFVTFITISALVLSFIQISPAVSEAQNAYYVAKDGSDSNPGTEAQPFLTIQKAANVAQAGDTVNVKAGTYDRFTVNNKTGANGSPITITKYPGDSQPIVKTIGITGSSYITIDGFEVWEWLNNGGNERWGTYISNSNHVNIQNSHYRWNVNGGSSASASGSIYMYDGASGSGNSYITIQNNEIENRIIVTGDNLTVSNNNFHDGKMEDSVRFFGTNIFIKGNRFSNWTTQQYGGYITDSAHVDVFQTMGWGYGDTRNVVIENNYIEKTHHGQVWMTECLNGLVYDLTFRNNVVVRESGYGSLPVALSTKKIPANIDAVRQNKIYNNTFVALDGNPTWFAMAGTSDGNYIKNNIFYGGKPYSWETGANPAYESDYNLYYNIGSGFSNPNETHSLWATDPRFVVFNSLDFHLQSTSPAIDAGTPNGASLTDKDGNQRVGAPDIGVYEYGGTSPTPSPPADDTIDTTPPEKPVVLSSSFRKKNFTLNFLATDISGIAGYSYVLDRQLLTVPDVTSEGTSTSKTFTNVSSGTWYFHIRAVDNNGNWSGTTQFKIIVDGSRPKTFATNKTFASKGRSTRLYYVVRDSFSGNKAYVVIKIKRNRKVVKKINLGLVRANRRSSRRIKAKMRKGKYRYFIYATDRAGNKQQYIGYNYLVVK